MPKKPSFGLLDGVKVAYAGSSIAAPFAPALMADMGANVIWIEHYLNADVQRTGTSYGYNVELDRRNQRTISLNIPSPEGREVFFRLLREIDIYIEGSRGGQYEKWGITDEVMWEVNPKLVIAHVSGYGQTGLPEYVRRSSYDPIAQAFGGLMIINKVEGHKSLPVYGAAGDYYAAYLAAFTTICAYLKAQKTGVGESCDIAQYEAVLRCLNHQQMDPWNLNRPFADFNDADRNSGTAGYNSYMCKDGEEIYMLALGGGVMRNLAELLQVGPDVIPEGVGLLFIDGREPDGHKLEEILIDFCAKHTAQEVEDAMNAKGIPCTRILKIEDMLDHPHMLARESITTWETKEGTNVIGPNIFPKLKHYPGQIWAPAPGRGQDNDEILAELGFSEEEIAAMYDKKIVTKAETAPVEVRKMWGDRMINPEGN